MNINDVFPSNFLKASDLRGKSWDMTIGSCAVEAVGSDQRLVVYFKGAKKGLVLNKTNAGVIASTYGPETDGWAGKTVQLFPSKTSFNGQLVDCLRVRVVPPVANAPSPPPEDMGSGPAGDEAPAQPPTGDNIPF